MFGLTCGCFSSFQISKIDVKIQPFLIFSFQQQSNQQMHTQLSNTLNEQGNSQSPVLDSLANQASITNSQNLQSNCSTIAPCPAAFNNEIMSNYTLQFNIQITNSQIQQNNDFLYIVPEKAPLSSCLSEINPRYKIRIEASGQDSTIGSAKYAIQNLALNEIYKIYYARRSKDDKLEALHTTKKFKLILRTKTQSTPKSLTNNNKSSKSLFAQNENMNLSNVNTSALYLEVVQVFEGDPDFYRENFDYEMKILMYTPQNKSKYNRLDTTPQTAPFQITYNQTQETFSKALNGNFQDVNKNIKNQSEGNSNFETCCNSLYQTNIIDNQIQQQQHLKSYFYQNQNHFGNEKQQSILTRTNNDNSQNVNNYLTANNNYEYVKNNPQYNSNSQNFNNHALISSDNNYSQISNNKNQQFQFTNNDQSQIVNNLNSQFLNNYNTQMNSNIANSHIISSLNYQSVNNSNENSQNKGNLQNAQNLSNLNSKCHSGQKLNIQNAQIDETFIIDDSKFNDYAAHMNNLLKQKIEQDNLCQDYKKNKQQNQENIPNNINCSQQLTLTKKQVMQKQKGKTISNYNSEEVMKKQMKENLNSNKMIIQSAPKQNIENKKGNNSTSKIITSQSSNKNIQLNKNQAFIYNSQCSNNNITPQSLSKKSSNNQFTANENNNQNNSYLSNQKALYRSYKESSQSQINCNKFIMQTPCKNTSVSQVNTNYKPVTPAGVKSVSHSGNIPRVKIDFQSSNNSNNLNNQSQGSFSQFGKLIKSQKKQSFLSSKKTSLTNTPKSSEQKLHLRFENDINRMMVQQKVQSTQEMMYKNLLNQQINTEAIQKNEINILDIQNIASSPQQKLDADGENTPVEQKLFTVEEANSPFETSINRFYTQKSSPSKYKLTQTEFNRIDECEEYNNTQYTNSDLKRIKYQLKQFRNDQESNSSSSQNLKTYEFYQNSPFNPDYTKISQNKSSQNINTMPLSRREKTILYMIPVYEYKMEKLGFNFTYNPETKNIIIQKKETSSNQHLQQSVFKIDERIKTDQLTNYFEDICANIKYQTID
ncbi:hypothetical protein TTHERM_00227110 (macronuclear) [Tetrahymena thermophila SB210]|uniref:Uncharacterized protein n=1 Tax=Tetrahymena thermophila (strain SB210) TaxID=312017 RepID=Q23BX1_TETTS|nr:hypothetical protein TTHERM_00227110 [Tetrahymena thermophila SB210]EAR93997.2 hypothetical protein TTHERM_00227110 [Tetrahymena thermophila SB210]|eukprot:XP_001014242.2 hypothetical protein TTHERM_00227110 [Tetrahymena thermophila SB210]